VPAPSIDRLTAALEPTLPWLVGLWGMGVCLLSWRLIQGGWSAHRLGRLQTTPVTAEWIERLRRLRHRMRVSRPVRLLQSALVEVPTVAGWFRPVILLPASTLTGLSVAQLELILAHELAHIRRCDPWVNLLQVLVETVLFYHPAVWWVSRCIREERELCCDDLAVQACGDRLAYAQALTLLETLRGPATTAALAASGGSLLQRIRHVLGLPGTPLASNWRRRTSSGLVGLGAVLFVVGITCLALSPKQYEAMARIVVSRDGDPSHPIGGSGEGAFDPYYVQTQVELLWRRSVLAEVVKKLNLAERWSNQGDVSPLTSEEAVARLRKRISARVVGNTDLIEIRVYDEVPADAAAIANTLAEAYRDQRLSAVRSAASQGIAMLEKKAHEANVGVKEQQERLAALRRGLNISDSDDTPAPLMQAETVRRLEAERVSVTSEIAGLAALVEKLREVPSQGGSDHLSKVMLTACPDQNLARLLQDLWTTEATLVKQTQTAGPDHPENRALKAMQEDLTRKVRECAEGLLAGLEVKLAAKRAQQDNLAKQADEARNRDAQTAEAYRPYFVAKRDLENQQKIRDAILLRTLQETVDASIPKSPMVEIVDAAEPPIHAQYPGHRAGLGLCGLGALCWLLGLVLRVTAPSASAGP
jgi:uncharacterized protein involved in exopolysaccharide biosynthesis